MYVLMKFQYTRDMEKFKILPRKKTREEKRTTINLRITNDLQISKQYCWRLKGIRTRPLRFSVKLIFRLTFYNH